MTSFTKQLTDKQYNFCTSRLNNFRKQSPNENIAFFAKYKGCTISIYKNKKILVQGSNIEPALQYLTINFNHTETTVENIIGCDEVGTGDYFGGIVCCACYVTKQNIEKLKSLGVNDSKKISDKNIKIIFDNILEYVDEYSFVQLTPEEFNEQYKKTPNMNAIKALCHDVAIHNIKDKIQGSNYKIVMDEFVDPKHYYSYIETYAKKPGQKIHIFTPKAESKYIAVAAASVIARKIWLDQIERLKSSLGHIIPLGSSSPKVKELANKISKKHLHKYVKLNFNMKD